MIRSEDSLDFEKIFGKCTNSSLIQKFLRTKKVKVNRKKVDSNYVLNEKDIINIFYL